jgi:hypothetical protein
MSRIWRSLRKKFGKTRLQIRHERAQEQANKADAAAEQAKVDIAKERTQFFEKLAIGSGAAITALVSFLGAHSEKLRPPWILRTSLVSLVVAILAALCRSLTYQKYFPSAADIRRSKSRIEEQELKRERNLQGGGEQPADVNRLAGLIKETQEALPKKESKKRWLSRGLTFAEYVCISAVLVAMGCLVWLAVVNF